MAHQLPAGSFYLDRRDMLNSLWAVYLSANGGSQHLSEDTYLSGYREGFENALLTVAAIAGVDEEFQKNIVRHKTMRLRRMRTVLG